MRARLSDLSRETGTLQNARDYHDVGFVNRSWSLPELHVMPAFFI